jgi:hypothetical protein
MQLDGAGPTSKRFAELRQLEYAWLIVSITLVQALLYATHSSVLVGTSGSFGSGGIASCPHALMQNTTTIALANFIQWSPPGVAGTVTVEKLYSPCSHRSTGLCGSALNKQSSGRQSADQT